MASIKDLKAKRAALKAQANAIATKETDENPLSQDEVSEFDKLMSAVDGIDARIARLEASAADEAEKSEEVDEGTAEKSFGLRTPTLHTKQAMVPRQKGSAVGRFLIGAHLNKSVGPGYGAEYVGQHFRDMDVKAALSTALPVIPQAFSTDLIDLLVAEAVVRKSGARVIPMPMGQLTIPRQRLGSEGTWMNEGENYTHTALDTDVINMTWKKVGALTSTTEELIRYSPLAAEQMIVNDLVTQMALTEDKAFLIGTGSATRPTGIINQIATSNKINSTLDSGAVTVNSVARDMENLDLCLRGNFVRGPKALYMAPGTISFLKTVRNAFGIAPFKDELDAGRFNGIPVYESGLLSTNLGEEANQALIVLAAVQDVYIGDGLNLEFKSTDTGSWSDGGTNVNAFGSGKVGFRLTSNVDIALAHGVSAAVLTVTDWTVGANQNVAGKAFVTEPANTGRTSASAARPAS